MCDQSYPKVWGNIVWQFESVQLQSYYNIIKIFYSMTQRQSVIINKKITPKLIKVTLLYSISLNAIVAIQGI